jgi:RNA polymerase sigma-70 factor (ECF subfamily)
VDSIADEQLMSQVRDGEVEALGFLYERHRTRLFNFFVRLTGDRPFSEDLVQESFLRMLKHRHTFESAHRFTAWMYQIGRNVHIDALRKRKRWHSPQAEEAQRAKIAGEGLAPDQALRLNEDVEILQSALAQLPLEFREPLILSRFHNLKYEEIAIILDCGVGAVKMRVHRGLKALRESYLSLTKENSL